MRVSGQTGNCHNPSKPADTARALEIVEAVLRFLGKNGILDYVCHGGYVSQLLEEHSMVNVKSNAAGFFLRKAEVSTRVKQGGCWPRSWTPAWAP